MPVSVSSRELPFQIRRSYLVDQVISVLRAQLADGQYQEGDRLPSEADLGRQFNVGRSTIREALRVLSHLGIVETWTGKGSFVRRQEEGVAVKDEMAIGAVADIYRFRFMVETVAAELAARERTQADVERIRIADARLKEAISSGSLDEAVNRDFELHFSFLAAAHNDFALQLYEEHRDEMVRATLSLLRLGRLAKGGSQDSPAALHDDLIDAIERQNPVAARRAVGRNAREFEVLLRLLTREHDLAAS